MRPRGRPSRLAVSPSSDMIRRRSIKALISGAANTKAAGSGPRNTRRASEATKLASSVSWLLISTAAL